MKFIQIVAQMHCPCVKWLIEARQILKSLVIFQFHLVLRLFFLISIFIRPINGVFILSFFLPFPLSSFSSSLSLTLSLSLSLFYFSFFLPRKWTAVYLFRGNRDRQYRYQFLPFLSPKKKTRQGKFLFKAAARSVRLIDAFFIHHRSN